MHNSLLSVDVDFGPFLPSLDADLSSTPPTPVLLARVAHTATPPPPSSGPASAPRAQIDTGASVSCTDQLSWLHDYVPFTPSLPCPIRLMPATVGSDASPVGFGHLHIPAINSRGYLAVRTFYTPALRTTVVDERDLILAAGHSRRDIESTQFLSNFDSGTFIFRANHKLQRSLDVVVTGILFDAKAYTHPLLLPFCDPVSIQARATSDPTFLPACERLALMVVHLHQEDAYQQLRHDLASLPSPEYIHQHTPILALRQDTERLLWHHRLGHPGDSYLFAAHRYIKGVHRFKHMDPILDSCPTCLRSKQTKNPAGPHTTRTATVPFQGLSIDFSFAGVRSHHPNRSSYFVGFNGETCWILISDHFSRFKLGYTRISKAAPLDWLRRFLQQHAPQCPGKYVHMDQGGELFANPQVRALFTEFGYSIFPTGADASHQNGPVERGHLTVANAIRSLLTGANLDVRFWPYAFHHWLRIDNSLTSRDQTATPLKIAMDKVDDFSDFRTFGCRVWVRPPGRRGAKFRPNSRKGIFLGFLPYTTRNILWFDPETNRVKIATHARFDEGMNDLPLADLPPNVVHLQRTQDGSPFPAEAVDACISHFVIGSSPFQTLLPRTLSVSCRRPAFGLVIASDDFNNRGFVSNILPNSSASRLFSSHQATLKRLLRGAYITRINATNVFTADDIGSCLRTLSEDAKADSLAIVFAPEPRLLSKQLSRAARELNIYAPPSPDDLLSHVHSITVSDIRAISAVRFPDLAFDALSIPLTAFHLAVHAIRSQATTSAEQALGHFTRRKLKRLDTWHLWHSGELSSLINFMLSECLARPSLAPHMLLFYGFTGSITLNVMALVVLVAAAMVLLAPPLAFTNWCKPTLPVLSNLFNVSSSLSVPISTTLFSAAMRRMHLHIPLLRMFLPLSPLMTPILNGTNYVLATPLIVTSFCRCSTLFKVTLNPANSGNAISLLF
jgi:hypothetical protein